MGLICYFGVVGYQEWAVFTHVATKEDPLTTAHLWLLADFIFHTIGFWACLILFWMGWGRK